MARATDALQPARHRLRALDLDDEVDCPHVDAELERRGRDQARDLAPLQELLDLDPLLPGDRAVVRARDLLFGKLVEAEREPLREPPVVDEHDRRAVLADELQELRVDRRPDRLAVALGAGVHLLAVGGRRVRERARGRQLAHVLDGHDDLQVELLRAARVDELDRAAAGDEAADLLERALRGREADALERLLDERLEPLDGQRQVRPALGAGDGVHLVEDQRPDALERLARLRGEHEVERLGRRDEDVGRVAEHLRPVALRRVAGAHADLQRALEPGQRPAQVALDVVVERLQRGDVQQADALPRLGLEAVEPEEERGQRLARPGRRLDERVRARRDDRPAALLGRRRRVESPSEPGLRALGEDAQRIHRVSLARSCHTNKCSFRTVRTRRRNASGEQCAQRLHVGSGRCPPR